MLMLACLAMASAQDAPPVSPMLDAQSWRHPIDAQRTLWTDDAGTWDDGYASARLVGGYVDDPFVFVWDDGGGRVAMVDQAAQVGLIGFTSFRRVRVGFDMPMYLVARGDMNRGGGFGDLAVDGKATVLSREQSAVGVALGARVSFPTATIAVPLASDGFGWDLQAIVDGEVGPVLLAANIGTRAVPNVRLPNVDLGDRAFARVGAGWAMTPQYGASLDFAGSTSYADLFAPAGTPIEGMLGGWGRVANDFVLRAGAGTGFTRGIGSPTARVVTSIAWEPLRGPVHAPEPVAVDTDRDGLLDADDPCPTTPEDIDEWEDTDGCPEDTLVRVRVVDPSGATIEGARVQLSGPIGEQLGGAELAVEATPGTYTLAANAEHFMELEAVRFDVTNGPPVEWLVELRPVALLGRLDLVVVDPDGRPVLASFSLGDAVGGEVHGAMRIEIEPGDYGLRVMADGYAPYTAVLGFSAGDLVQERVVLQPARVRVVRSQIDLREKVYFETNQAAIKPESYALLDEIATLLRDRPDIARIRIEGHTDSRGHETYNRDLSERRAAAVRAFLTERGIEPERLASVGLGEERPVDPNENPDAWEKNRRVELHVVEWAR